VLTVGILRELLRHLQAWESLYETDNIDTITGPDGVIYSLTDIQYLYSCRTMLSPRQRQSIELCLYENIKEKDATKVMGVSSTNPVAMYATNGMVRLVQMIDAGELPRYQPEIALVAS
jgi:hypothetical protein